MITVLQLSPNHNGLAALGHTDAVLEGLLAKVEVDQGWNTTNLAEENRGGVRTEGKREITADNRGKRNHGE